MCVSMQKMAAGRARVGGPKVSFSPEEVHNVTRRFVKAQKGVETFIHTDYWAGDIALQTFGAFRGLAIALSGDREC